MKNYTELFEEFLDLIEFTLIKHKNTVLVLKYKDLDGNDVVDEHNGVWSLWDRQGANLGDIEQDRFDNASQIIDRLDAYIEDYIIRPIEEYLEFDGLGLPDHYVCWDDLFEKRHLVGRDILWEVDVLDMIISHADEINLEECYYEMED
jgi:hypothetical protein